MIGATISGILSSNFNFCCWYVDNKLNLNINLVLAVEWCPPQINVEVLTPNTSDCELVWQQDLYRGNSFKRRSVGWALVLNDSVVTKGGAGSQAQSRTEGRWQGHAAEDGHRAGVSVWHLQAQEPRIAPSTRSWNRQGGALRQGRQREHTLLATWFQTFSLQNYQTVSFCSLKPPSDCCFVMIQWPWLCPPQSALALKNPHPCHTQSALPHPNIPEVSTH